MLCTITKHRPSKIVAAGFFSHFLTICNGDKIWILESTLILCCRCSWPLYILDYLHSLMLRKSKNIRKKDSQSTDTKRKKKMKKNYHKLMRKTLYVSVFTWAMVNNFRVPKGGRQTQRLDRAMINKQVRPNMFPLFLAQNQRWWWRLQWWRWLWSAIHWLQCQWS